ncbi:ATP-binding protein [Pseudoduganella sp. LjRoot289]
MFKHFKPGSLRFRVVIASVAVEAVLLTVMIGNSVRLIDNAAQASVAAALAQAVPMLNAAAAPYLLERDYSGLQDFLDAIVGAESRELSQVSMSEASGREVARAGLPRGAALAPPSASVAQAMDEGVYRAERPVAIGGERLGTMRIGLSTRIVADTRAAMVRQGLLIALAEIALSVLVLGLLGFWLTRHLERAAAASRAIGDGDYTIRLSEQGGGEVAGLARAVNRMAQEVEHREHALHALNTALEQRVAERTSALALSVQEQRTILDNAIVGIIFIRDRTILRCNRGWADLLGYSCEELEGRSTRIYYPSDEAYGCLGEQLYPSIAAGQAIYGESSFARRDGSLIDCSFQGKAIDPADPSKGSIWVLQDITARKAAERELDQRTRALQDSLAQLRSTQLQLVQAEKLAALGQLVAGIAHELNTPIGNIVTMTSALDDMMTDASDALARGQLTRIKFERLASEGSKASEVVLRNAARAATLIDKFKLVAADHTQDHRCRFGLGAHVRNVLAGVEQTLRGQGVALTVDVAQEVQMDSYPGLVAQVLIGLVNNALDHAWGGIAEPLLRVRVDALPDGRAAMVVSDNGRGIAATVLPRIFEPFYTTRRGAGHAGLGLHILHNVVTAALEGEIHVASQAGIGTAVSLTLACAPGLADGAGQGARMERVERGEQSSPSAQAGPPVAATATATASGLGPLAQS